MHPCERCRLNREGASDATVVVVSLETNLNPKEVALPTRSPPRFVLYDYDTLGPPKLSVQIPYTAFVWVWNSLLT